MVIAGLILLLPVVIQAQSNISLLDDQLIRENRIKEITEWNYPFIGEKPTETGTVSLKTLFDTNGYLLEETTYNSRGQESRRITSRFDNMGNRTEHKIFDSRNNRLTYSQMASYDHHGNKLLESGFDGLGDYRNIYHRLPDGRISGVDYYSQRKLKEKRVFSYNGNTTSISVLGPDNRITQKITLSHDKTGNLLEEAYFDEQDNLMRRVEYDYDSSGLKTEERRYQGEQIQYRNSFIYENSLLVETIRTDRQGLEVVTNRYTYNDKGQLVKEAWYNQNADDYSTKHFTWDNEGNMVSVACYYASYQFYVFYRYDYSFF
jgi:YD repeat-containing protein